MRQLKRRHIWCTLLALSLITFACSKTPSGVLPEKKMQAVLTDMQIAEAMISVDYASYQDSGYKDALYQSVFDKHKITQAVYDSSLIWYGKNLNIYMKMYERIRDDIDIRIKDLGNVQASATTSSRNDSVDIWPFRPYYIFRPEGLFNGIVFDIEPNRSYPSGSTFVLGLRLWGNDLPGIAHPEIHLAAVQGDTIVTVRDIISGNGYHETTLRTIPTRQVRRVYGYIRLDNGDPGYFGVFADSLNLMRYNYRSDFTVQPADSTTVENP